MVDQKSSIWERLKICWYVLTKKNYIYFGIGKNPIKFDENGFYKNIEEDALKCYVSVSYDYKFNTNYGEANLHDVVWNVVEEVAQHAQKGEY